MIPAISMWSLEAEINNSKWLQKDFINWAAQNGIKHVELVSYYMDRENNPAEIKSLLDDSGMTVSCYTILNDFSSSDDDGMAVFNKDLKTAVIIGAPNIRVLTGEKACDSIECKNTLIERFKLAARAAEEHGIRLILENIGPLSGHSDEAVDIIKKVNSESFKINFDTANPLLADENPLEAMKKMLPYIAYVHLKDFITEQSENFEDYAQAEWRIQKSKSGIKMTGITPGQGEVQLSEMLKILIENNYEGFVSVEYENDLSPKQVSLDSLAYIKNCP